MRQPSHGEHGGPLRKPSSCRWVAEVCKPSSPEHCWQAVARSTGMYVFTNAALAVYTLLRCCARGILSEVTFSRLGTQPSTQLRPLPGSRVAPVSGRWIRS